MLNLESSDEMFAEQYDVAKFNFLWEAENNLQSHLIPHHIGFWSRGMDPPQSIPMQLVQRGKNLGD